jgi:hypothetical protein
MKPNFRISPASLKYGLSALSAASLLLTGCQTETPVSPAPPSQSEYTSNVLKLKASRAADYDKALAELNARFSILADGTPAAIPASTVGAAAKSAAILSFKSTVSSTPVVKFVFRATAGANATITASVAQIGTMNPADPMIALIQFNDAAFKSNGTLNKFGQQGFRIVAFNDDTDGKLDSYLSHTFTFGEVGYYMWIVMPYTSSAATGKVNLTFDLTNPDCPACQADYVFQNPVTLGGAAFHFVAGNDFQVERSGTAGTSHLYVLNNTAKKGMANGKDILGVYSSRVYSPPFSISDSDAFDSSNLILVDNDDPGTTFQGTLSVYQR